VDQLIPCPSCNRHHRVSEAVCPFCGLTLPGRKTSPALTISRARMSRATLIAAGAAWLGAGACDSNISPPYGAPPPGPVQDASSDAPDAGSAESVGDAKAGNDGNPGEDAP
jgi:hypothetical protein